MKTVKFLINGKVQGVWFRASTEKIANELGVSGHANNLMSGQVEVVATGNEQQLELLYAFLQTGPELAVVEHIDIEDLPFQEFESFTTG